MVVVVVVIVWIKYSHITTCSRNTGPVGVSQEYVDDALNDLQKQFEALKKNLSKNTKNELKRFERDVMVFLEDSKTDNTETSVGRIHFRCVSCDQVTQGQHGPATANFKQAVAGSGVHVGHAAKPQLDNVAPNMLVERGEEVSLYGRDGQIYKGRDNTTTVFATPNPHKNANFTIAYRVRADESFFLVLFCLFCASSAIRSQ